MLAVLKSRWVLFVVLAVFIAFKVPHLYYPYYWDESWPYATAIKAMFDHGLSFMPDAIDAEISRGHPLFFHVLAAGWMKIFGGSHFAMHSFALLISVLFLVAVFEAGFRLFNSRVACMALVLVASQELFFVQSSFVLFEMLIAFLCFLSLWCYVRDKYVLTAVFLTMLFYTKESGLIMGFVLGIDAFSGLFNKNLDRRTVLYRLLSVGVPCVLIGVFFLLQKHIRGWYIFPFYSEIMENSWNMYWYKFRIGGVQDTFAASLKHWYFILLLLVAAFAAIKNKKWKYLAIFVPALFIYYFVDDKRAGRIMPGIPFFTLFVVAWGWFLWVFSRSDVFTNKSQKRFFVLTGCFVFCFLCFSAMNYYTYRYMLAVIVPGLFITAVFCDAFITVTHRGLYYVYLAAFAVISYFAFAGNKAFGDSDRGAFIGMDVQQHVVDFMEQNQYYDKNIAIKSYVGWQHLADPGTGFLKSNRRFPKVQWAIADTTDLVIFDNIETDYRYEKIKSDSGFQLIFRFAKEPVWTEVYKRRIRN